MTDEKNINPGECRRKIATNSQIIIKALEEKIATNSRINCEIRNWKLEIKEKHETCI